MSFSLSFFKTSFSDLSLAFSRWRNSYVVVTAITKDYCSFVLV